MSTRLDLGWTTILENAVYHAGMPLPFSPYLGWYNFFIHLMLHSYESYGICSKLINFQLQETTLVSQDFAVNFDHELSPEWKLFDHFGKVHLVSYQTDLEESVLFKGLWEIRRYYSLKGLNWCLLKYHGFSNFELLIYNENIEEVCYLPRHPPLI